VADVFIYFQKEIGELEPDYDDCGTSFFIDAWKAAKDSSDRMDEFKRRQNQPK